MTDKAGADTRAPAELAALIRDKDWSQTPLGPREAWSPALSMMVQLIMASGFPMAVRWGPQFVMVYNDGYRAILGEKYPWALGLPFDVAWPEVQSDLRPLHDAILSGESPGFFGEDFPLRIQRRGDRWEDAKFTISYSPVPDNTTADGIGGVLITVVETTDRVLAEKSLRASEAALRQSEDDLRLVLNSATDAIYCIDSEGTTTRCNAAFLRMLGIANESGAIGKKLHGVIHHSHPDGTPYPKEDCPIYQSARSGTTAHVDREVFFRFDGTAFPVEYWVAPIIRDGMLQGAVCTFIDITERRRAEERQSLLLGELNHRVKNLFALIGSMITLSARSAASPKELAADMRGRLDALAMAHDLVLPHAGDVSGAGHSTTLAELLAKVLSPYGSEKGAARFALHGPAVGIGPHAVTRFALVLHELATNSAKYGALSAFDGIVHVTWADLNGQLVMKWEERGGPRLSEIAPPKSGFGTVLAHHSIKGDFGGSLGYNWNSQGLVVDIAFPMERLDD
ncbi:MAG TPA: HWE histidine kinase domain-containing protein [Rhizomicrobium sp.]